MKKKILGSIATIGAVAALAVFATGAFFSDEETSVDNTFEAGAIDLMIDYEGYYNKAVDGQPNAGDWDLKDLQAEKFFEFDDVKPGDFGEGTLSIHVDDNDAWMCMYIENMESLENGINDPESEAGDNTEPEGELADNLYFTAWMDDGNNIWDEGEPLLFANQYGLASDVLNGKTYALADSTTGYGPFTGGETHYIGIKWCAGAMSVDEATGVIACDGSAMGNKSQTDSVTADLRFYVEQSRNNPDFVCPGTEEVYSMTLENKDNEYNRLTNDGRYGVLTWAGDGPTFDYELEAWGLPANTEYSMLYYADGWPGNNPGYHFGNATSNGSGYLIISGNPDLGMDLPDSADDNYGSGAKIWLVPSTVYNSGTLSITTWPFDTTWLFESNLINYDDTD